MDLKARNIIVTGGASGIGRCLVGRLVQAEAVVGVWDVNEEALASLLGEYPEVRATTCDITVPAQVATAVEAFFGEFGAIDGLVNNAGMIHNSLLVAVARDGIRRYDLAQWDKTIATNLSAVFYVTTLVIEKMIARRTRGVIVNVSSIAAAGNVGQSAYSAAKAGVEALTVTWAKEFGYFGVRVAGIAPGFTATEAVRKSMTEDVLNDWVRQTPLRRLAKPEEIADGIMFILQNDAINGRILEIDLGLRL